VFDCGFDCSFFPVMGLSVFCFTEIVGSSLPAAADWAAADGVSQVQPIAAIEESRSARVGAFPGRREINIMMESHVVIWTGA
jgi:hypothetical protein